MSVPRLAVAAVAGFCTSVRETLPADEHEAGMFLAGMTWAFVIFMLLLVAVSMAWAQAHGVRL